MNPPDKVYCATCSKCGLEEIGVERRVRHAAANHVGSGPDDHRSYVKVTTYVKEKKKR